LGRIGLWLPLLLLPLAVLSEYSGLDLWLARKVYDPEAGLWTLKRNWWCKDVLHDAAQTGTVVVIAVLLISTILVRFVPRWKRLRNPLLYVFFGTLVGPLVIGVIKNTSVINIPWKLTLFGGERPYIRIFDSVPEGASKGLGFPAAHAAAGYMWFSLYFLGRHCRWRRTGWILFGALLLGVLFGGAQQFRGAHFLSHDLVTIVICWYASLACYALFIQWKRLAPAHG
jgi:membrane-associated PAP2 superfamily phosphatase